MPYPVKDMKKGEDVREGEDDQIKKDKKNCKKRKKDTEIEKGGVANEGVTKMNKSPMTALDAATFKQDQCWKGYVAYGTKKKGNRTVPNCVPVGKGKKKGKKDSIWADGFEYNDAAYVLTAGADKLATEKYAREKRKRNAQSQPHNMIYANTYNT